MNTNRKVLGVAGAVSMLVLAVRGEAATLEIPAYPEKVAFGYAREAGIDHLAEDVRMKPVDKLEAPFSLLFDKSGVRDGQVASFMLEQLGISVPVSAKPLSAFPMAVWY